MATTGLNKKGGAKSRRGRDAAPVRSSHELFSRAKQITRNDDIVSRAVEIIAPDPELREHCRTEVHSKFQYILAWAARDIRTSKPNTKLLRRVESSTVRLIDLLKELPEGFADSLFRFRSAADDKNYERKHFVGAANSLLSGIRQALPKKHSLYVTMSKRELAHIAYSLLRKFGRKRTVSADSAFLNLSSVLYELAYGLAHVELERPCREVLRWRRG